MTRFPTAKAAESLRFFTLHFVPTLLRGPLLARPRLSAALNKLDTAKHAARFVGRLRQRYPGAEAVWVRGLRGPMLLALTPSAVQRVLGGPVASYAVDSPEKHKMLGGMQPDSLILSRGGDRVLRRRFNESVLGFGSQEHPHAARLRAIIAEETGQLLAGETELTAARLDPVMQRIARRVILGDAAAGDQEVTDLYLVLRREGNWLGTRRWKAAGIASARERLLARFRAYAGSAEPGSLIARSGAAQGTVPEGQVTHWLLAFDIIAGTVLGTLAMLGADPYRQLEAAKNPEYLRACVLETLRLWPPVRDLYRETTTALDWDGLTVPAGTGILLPAAYHQRAGVANADSFQPESRDLGSRVRGFDAGYFPFSGGGATCAGRDLGLLITSALLGELLDRGRFRLLAPVLRPAGRLPYLLPASAIRLSVQLSPAAGNDVYQSAEHVLGGH
ncbi:cytochrome P450 [Longispora albida]|uniref:cytochrome P450 n=1 Tax=Longispora albida TaxID=203523 RepID=UPI0003624456|nr:cytochrome P450 [Longispora albida]